MERLFTNQTLFISIIVPTKPCDIQALEGVESTLTALNFKQNTDFKLLYALRRMIMILQIFVYIWVYVYVYMGVWITPTSASNAYNS